MTIRKRTIVQSAGFTLANLTEAVSMCHIERWIEAMVAREALNGYSTARLARYRSELESHFEGVTDQEFAANLSTWPTLSSLDMALGCGASTDSALESPRKPIPQ